MRLRLLSALVGLPIIISAIWFGFPWLTFLVVAIALLGLREFINLASRAGARVPILLAVVLTLALLLHGEMRPEEQDLLLPILGSAILASALWFLVAGRLRSLADWAFTLAGPLYVGFLLSHALLLREAGASPEDGRDWLLFALLTTFATDTGSFFTGRLLGRHPLAPSISPGKTWEGAAGGLAWAIGAALALGAILKLPTGAWVQALLGVAIGVLGQAGDLVESRFKRAAGVKDTGTLIPGHGGILDRLDSVVFTIPVMYYVVAYAL